VKKKLSVHLCSACCLLFAGALASCPRLVYDGSGEQTQPVSIYIAPGDGGSDTSFQADVEVYRTNSRSVEGTTLLQKYRLSVKEIDGYVVRRLDFSPELAPDQRGVSVITDGITIVVFDTATLEVRSRTTLPEELAVEAQSAGQRVMPGSFDVAAVRRESARLGFALQEDTSQRLLALRYSVERGSALGELRTDIVVDTETETIQYQQAVFTERGGVSVTTEQQYAYEVQDGRAVIVAEVTTVAQSHPADPAAPPPGGPWVAAPEEVPVVDAREIEQLEAAGAVVRDTDPVIGDPSSQDSTDTVVKTYDGIRINTLDDSLFRLPFFSPGGGAP
jgi:hypothetical protein